MKSSISYEIRTKVIKYIENNHLTDDIKTVVVGLSGGADSVCLLKILHEISGQSGFDICAVHVHHGIRGESADRDQQFSEKICKNMGIPYRAEYADIPLLASESGESVEECARRIRYEILNKIAAEFENSAIAVAHHKDDQAETILFRMIRGTGIKGLAAMQPQNGIIIRPLLCLTRREILSYLAEAHTEYVSDETNEDTAYSRNRIRLNILPEAEKICEGAAEHIADICTEAKEASDFIEKCAGELLRRSEVKTDHAGELCYRVDDLKSAEKIVLQTAIRRIVDEMIHSLKDITKEHIESVRNLLDGYESRSINLPKKLNVLREGNYIRFVVGQIPNTLKAEEFYVKIDGPESVILPEGKELEIAFDDVIELEDITQNIYTKWLDYDKISAGLCLRYRQEGDYLIIDNRGSKKSLKKYMVDEKIPKSERSTIPVLARGHEIFWVLGHRISESAKVTENTQHIIRFELKEKSNHE